MAGPAARAEMHAGPEGRCQPRVPGHHEREAAPPADAGEVASKRLASRLTVVAQHHTRQAAGQPCRGRAGIGQPSCVGEQPQPGQLAVGAGTGRRRVRPGDEPRVHGPTASP